MSSEKREFVEHPHIEALRARHALLSSRIDAAQRQHANDLALREMKREKLAIKEEIAMEEARRRA